MSVNANSFLTSAKASLLKATSEIDYRNVASRAYYTGYHIGQEVAERYNIPLSGSGGCHARMICGLQNYSKNKDIRKIGDFLSSALDFREKADYHINQEFKKLFAEATINKIMAVTEKVKTL